MADGKKGDPDAIGHSADGHYLDFSPVGKVELPRIFVVKGADGLRVDFFGTTHSALDSGNYGLRINYSSDAELLTEGQVETVIEEHTHFKFPVIPTSVDDELIVDLSITRQMVFVFLCGLILFVIPGPISLATRSRTRFENHGFGDTKQPK